MGKENWPEKEKSPQTKQAKRDAQKKYPLKKTSKAPPETKKRGGKNLSKVRGQGAGQTLRQTPATELLPTARRKWGENGNQARQGGVEETGENEGRDRGK